MSKWDTYRSVSYAFILACIFVFLFASLSFWMLSFGWKRAPYWRELIPKWSMASLKSNAAFLSFVQGILFQLCCLMRLSLSPTCLIFCVFFVEFAWLRCCQAAQCVIILHLNHACYLNPTDSCQNRKACHHEWWLIM